MADLDFLVKSRSFVELPFYGKDHVMARPGEGGPLFNPKDRVESSSPYLDRIKAKEVIAHENPCLPEPPEEAIYVVAGQQPGLLSGPLYTFLKAAGAISLAKRLSTEWETAVLPLFWVASEDHDLLEVNRVFVNNERYVHPYPGEIRRGRVPQVADIPLDGAREPLHRFLEKNLPETEFTPWIMDLVESIDYGNYASAFTGLMASLFSPWELRLVNAHSIRTITAPVLAALVKRWPEVRTCFRAGPLAKPGFFEIVKGARKAVEIEEETVLLQEGEFSFEEAAEQIRLQPERFSPNAALRPILQDASLPVAVTLCGPSELQYLWQIQPLYSVIEAIPAPLQPRLSATFVEDRILKAAIKSGLDQHKIFEAAKVLKERLDEGECDPETELFEEKARDFLEEMDRLGENKRWLKKSREAISTKVEKVLRRFREEKLAATGLTRSRLEKIEAALFPGGKPQERQVNVMQFLNLYGPDFIRLAVERLDPLEMGHQVVFMGTEH